MPYHRNIAAGYASVAAADLEPRHQAAPRVTPMPSTARKTSTQREYVALDGCTPVVVGGTSLQPSVIDLK